MDDDSDRFITVEAESNPESLRVWLSIVKERKTSTQETRQLGISTKVKKHLSSLGWRFAYVRKGASKELRYKSPEGMWFNSLAKACKACLKDADDDDDSCQEQEQEQEAPVSNVPKKTRAKVCDTPPFNGDKNKINQQQEEAVIRRPGFGDSLKTNCDVCCVCHHGGGDMLRCNGCPSSFHHACSGLSSIAPDEQKWFYCPCCCCVICNQRRTPGGSMLLACEQCRRRWHRNCLKRQSFIRLPWFCSSQCSRVSSALEKLQGAEIAVGDDEGLVWSLRRASNDAVEMLLKSFKRRPDRFSGRDLVEELMFSRDSDGVGRKFYTVSIERNGKPITVAAVRVGKDVAEIPLVATECESGMCRVLMDELEKQLSEMGVCRLVLPALAEDVKTWTERFGFSVMESSERLELLKRGLFGFLGAVMCQKSLKGREEP